MGIFDRIGNLGKGKLGIIKSDGPASRERHIDDLDSEIERRRANKALEKGQVPPSRARRKASDALDKLKKLHESGLLSDEEYAEKVAAASGLMGPLPSSGSEDERAEEHAVETETVEHDGGVKKTL